MKKIYKILLSAMVMVLVVGCGSSSETTPAGGKVGDGIDIGTGTDTGNNPVIVGVSEVDGGGVFLEIIKRAQYFRAEAKELQLEGTGILSILVNHDHSDGNRTRTITLNSFGNPNAEYTYNHYDKDDAGTIYDGTAELLNPFGADIYYHTFLTATGQFAHTEELSVISPDRNTTNITIYGEIKMQNIVIDDIAIVMDVEDDLWTISTGRFYVYRVTDAGELETSPFYCELLSGTTTPIAFDTVGDVDNFTLGCSDENGIPVEFNYTK